MLDPVSADGVEIMEYAQLFLEHAVPARIGLVLVSEPDDPIGIAICQRFAFTAEALSPSDAFHWLIKVRVRHNIV